MARGEVPPLIAQWKRDLASENANWFTRWTRSQVASYRLELIMSYLAMMFFGATSIAAGIPIFTFTTPLGWTPIWGAFVIAGGLVAAIGALRAGEEPQTRVVRVFNRVELGGSIVLFLMLGTYAALLLLIGNGAFDDARLASGLDPVTVQQNLARVAVGAALAALGIRPAIRMVWLLFRPGKLADTGPIPVIPQSHESTTVVTEVTP
ncbi:MAG: hypothetical protein ABIQ01_11265 [Pseudolysinimonas sp.]